MTASEIGDAFARTAAANRHRIAIRGLSEDVVRTFGDLQDDVVAIGRAIDDLALPSQETIIASVGNRSGFVPLFLACLERGAALLALDGGGPPPEIMAMADRLNADLIVVRAGDAGSIAASSSVLPCGLAAITCPRSTGPAWRTSADTGALVLRLTSGSTRRPKFVVTTEANLLSDGEHIIEAMNIRAADVTLAAIPLAHAYGCGNVLLPLLLRGTQVVMRDSFVPVQLAGDLAACGITTFPGVPFLFDYLQRLGPAAAAIAGVRLLVTAGAPIETGTLRYFKQTFGLKIHSLYGTSETGGITFDASDELIEPVTVGVPLPGTLVTLVETHGGAAGEGRVLVRGANVAARYAMTDPDTDESSAFTPQGFLTSDLARVDGHGRLTLLGRVSGFVNVAGRKVDPADVERVIASLAGVQHVAVIAAACPVRGQILAACVRRVDPTLTAGRIRTHCAAHLSAHKVPRVVVFSDHLPVDGRGKTDRRVVDELVASAMAEQGRV